MGSVAAGLGAIGNTLGQARELAQQDAEIKRRAQIENAYAKIRDQIMKAPQVAYTYKTPDGKVVNLMRDPVTGRITPEIASGPAEGNKYQQEVAELKSAFPGITESQIESKIGIGPKPSTASDKILIPPGGGLPYGKLKGGKVIVPGMPEWEASDQAELDAATKSAKEAQAGKGTQKVDPIIDAQLGPRPDPSQFPLGKLDPKFKALDKQWGINAENIKNRMAQQRGIGYNLTRPGAYVTPDGQLVTATAGTAIAGGYVPAAPAFNAMTKGQQFVEMKNASGNLRSAIEALKPEDAFTPEQVVQLRLAAGAQDEGVFQSILGNMAAAATNDRQQNYLIWLQQMGERILSLRNVAGMGQGAQDLRAAITATLPNISSGSKQFALKRLDAVDNQINLLQKGIPTMPQKKGAETNAPIRTIDLTK